MIMGACCLTHTPYMDRARAARDLEGQFFSEVSRLASEVAQANSDIVIVLHPDHYNGFFYNLMPAFCVGINARSIGDYGTVEGQLPVPSDLATDLTRTCLSDGIDVAFAHRMEVDHGLAQPLEMIFAGSKLPYVVPVFINCAASPRPSFSRVSALGAAIGRWAHRRSERIYIIASGGLSHDPPMPSLTSASGASLERLVKGGAPTYAERFARQSGVFAAGHAFVAGEKGRQAINTDWDRDMLQAFVDGRLDVLNSCSEAELTQTAGTGAHEARTWIAALSALAAVGRYTAQIRFYAPIPEWITGTAILKAELMSGTS
jgi:2,3-dihydroxyphenylpropionate 1,2-dioxygenase